LANPGIIAISNGGKNGFLQAVLQSILKIDLVAKFFLQKQYIMENLHKQVLCGLIHQIYADFFQK
jgi:hypothetical protein